MIRNLAIFISIALCIAVSSSAFAAKATTAVPGDRLTQTADNSPGGPLTYDPSPSTLMVCFTSATAYAIQSASGKTTTANGLEYGILSSDEGYFQRTQTVDNACPDLSSATSLAGAAGTWKNKNGTTPGY